VKERPILFSGPMVSALLAGTKTQTRRVIKVQPSADVERAVRQVAAETCIDAEPGTHFFRWVEPAGVSAGFRCPYGQVGDRLWVRETHAREELGADGPRLVFRADMEARWLSPDSKSFYLASDYKPTRWTPAIHMPRWASRLTLEITEVRVQRLLKITDEDAKAEGFPLPPYRGTVNGRAATIALSSPKLGFKALWLELNNERPGCGWESNPWVWCVSFRRVS
jgi:hypothetical protein